LAPVRYTISLLLALTSLWLTPDAAWGEEAPVSGSRIPALRARLERAQAALSEEARRAMEAAPARVIPLPDSPRRLQLSLQAADLRWEGGAITRDGRALSLLWSQRGLPPDVKVPSQGFVQRFPDQRDPEEILPRARWETGGLAADLVIRQEVRLRPNHALGGAQGAAARCTCTLHHVVRLSVPGSPVDILARGGEAITTLEGPCPPSAALRSAP
jgi:hypothetical protein